jgi:phosphocarrier protein HPr
MRTVSVPSAELTVINKLGLHARAAAKLTQVASQFAADVWLTRNGRRVNAKSIMGVMMLAAGRGAALTVDADGADAEAALAAIRTLVADKFGEGE